MIQHGKRFLAALFSSLRREPVQVRHYRETPIDRIRTRHFGFENHIKYHIGGFLPRIKPTPELKPISGTRTKFKNSWALHRAAFGQNDYIDILGDGTLHPRDLLKGPVWLKGFRGSEMQRLIRRRNYGLHWMPMVYPEKWTNLLKQLRYLDRYHNFKQNHKDWKNRYEAKAHKWDIMPRFVNKRIMR
ncbi:39S ribosomal protein L51, mitochondrial-like [Paramacrobiotus metropolitanus]|uniref:39S ribosomal protein L51, mitochondrial-like n=1 Tax=Paramacrobiotus metropolitanus TaxID=2943436 RepID=UPI0024455F2C|nr:39S ribosomal protein L51, mitochondrial-like [Paramacrobiotus metropolitanus]